MPRPLLSWDLDSHYQPATTPRRMKINANSMTPAPIRQWLRFDANDAFWTTQVLYWPQWWWTWVQQRDRWRKGASKEAGHGKPQRCITEWWWQTTDAEDDEQQDERWHDEWQHDEDDTDTTHGEEDERHDAWWHNRIMPRLIQWRTTQHIATRRPTHGEDDEWHNGRWHHDDEGRHNEWGNASLLVLGWEPRQWRWAEPVGYALFFFYYTFIVSMYLPRGGQTPPGIYI